MVRRGVRRGVALGLGIAAASCGLSSEHDAPAQARLAVAAPAVAYDLRGQPVAIPSERTPTVLVFVTSTCPLSNRYVPSMRALFAGWLDQGVSPWLVYPDPDDDAAVIAAHQREYNLRLPTLRDPEHAVVALVGARVTPEAAVFVAGEAVPVYRGRIDDRVTELGKMRPEASTHELREAVAAVVRGERPPVATQPAIGCYISDLR